MSKPVILSVDDEPQVLNAINRDLRQHYRNEYRIVRAGSGSEALAAVGELKERNTPIALFLADQRMPIMSGTEFLIKAQQFYPDARKVLLTAYADTEAAITSINTIGLDRYLMKPWDPPEQNLFPALDDLLSDWWHTVPPPYDGIRVAGALWSSDRTISKIFWPVTASPISGRTSRPTAKHDSGRGDACQPPGRDGRAVAAASRLPARWRCPDPAQDADPGRESGITNPSQSAILRPNCDRGGDRQGWAQACTAPPRGCAR